MEKSLPPEELKHRQSKNKKKRDINPLEVETSFFKPYSIVFEEDDFIIARGLWKPTVTELLCCRWHIRGQLGFPNSYGKPMWMQLPESVQQIQIPSVTKRDKRLCVLSFGDLTGLFKADIENSELTAKRGKL
jgi:hypothetical protein